MTRGHAHPLDTLQTRELERAFALLKAGRIPDASLIAAGLAVAAPLAPDAHQLHALCLADAGDIDSAQRAFQHALQLSPDHPLLLSNYATMLRKAGRPLEAMEIARRAVDSAPRSAKAWLDLASTAEMARDPRQALGAAHEALRLQSGLAAAWEVVGRVSRELEDIETAAAAFDRVIQLKPGDRSAWMNLGMMHRLAGRPEESITSLERGLRACGWNPQLADALSGALLDAGRPAEAIALARTVVQQVPDFAPGVATLANLLWEYSPERGDASHAVFDKAMARQPDNAALSVAYVQFLLATGGDEVAVAQVRRLRERGDQPWLALLEAQGLDRLGQTGTARALHAALHETAAGSTSVGYLNAYARHLLGARDAGLAASVAKRATCMDPDNQEAWSQLAIAWRLLDDPREFWLCDYERLISLVEVDAPVGFDGSASFLQSLAETLDAMHLATHEPMHQSLRAGSQTPGRLFGRPDPVIETARQALLLAVERWLASLPVDDKHPFLRRKRPRVRIGGSWSVRLRSSGSHVNHIHSEGWISSAFYVSLPPSVTDNKPAHGVHPGAIQFGQPPLELGLGLEPRRVVLPRPGTLALFPSYVWHGTVPFEDSVPRTTIAFDMVPMMFER